MKLTSILTIVGSVAVVMATTVTQSYSQTAPPPEKSSLSAKAPDATDDEEEMTLAGCLMRHRDVPVPTAAIATNSAVTHDGFLLVDARVIPHHRGTGGMQTPAAASAAPHDHAAAHAAAEPPEVVEPTPNVADSQMFKVEGLPDAELEQYAGTRVTLMGALMTGERETRRLASGADSHQAAGFAATMVHPASTPCRQ